MVTAIIVDDQPYIRVILKRILGEEGVTVTAECVTGVDGIARARELQPDILITELVLPGIDGLDAISRIRRHAPTTQIIVVTACPAEFSMDRCMRAGVVAYISKSNDVEVFRRAIQAVRAGFICFPNLQGTGQQPSHADPDERVRIAGLSGRELAVLRYLALGFSNLQIGEALLLSNKTISSYKTRLVKKLRVKSVICLAEMARRHGVI